MPPVFVCRWQKTILFIRQLIVINYKDTIRITGDELIDEISTAYGTCGMEGTIIVVNSNKQANRYNQGIRNRIFFREEEISTGDMVMVVKNNYSIIDEDEEGAGFIANGDIAEVRKIRKYRRTDTDSILLIWY